MALSDPQSVTINAVANSLPRISMALNSGAFQKDDATVRLDVSHNQTAKRSRHYVRLSHSKIAPDPLISSTNIKYSMSVSINFDTPPTGYTVAEQKQVVDGFIAWLNASSGANITKILGAEN
jgi:hypothetical protein